MAHTFSKFFDVARERGESLFYVWDVSAGNIAQLHGQHVAPRAMVWVGLPCSLHRPSFNGQVAVNNQPCTKKKAPSYVGFIYTRLFPT